MKEIDDSLLNAWLDGELPADQRDRVAAWLEAHPEEAQRVRGWAADRDALQARLEPMQNEPVPDELVRLVMRHNGSKRLRWLVAAAMAATFVLGGAAGAALTWHAQRDADVQAASDGGWPQRAALAHSVYVPEVRHPVEVDIANASAADQPAQEAHLAAWLTKRLSVPVKLFDLRAQGFELVGGRLLPDASDAGHAAPSAQLMYQATGGKQRVTVYLRKPEPGTLAAFRYEQQGDLGLFYWVEGAAGRETGYALVGALPKERLLEIATAIYRQGERAN